MLDIPNEISLLQLLKQQAGTGTITGSAVQVNQFNTGDIDAATLMITGISGAGTITVQLQGSATGTGGWSNLTPTAAMPNTAFTAVSANMSAPAVLPIDPRGLPSYIRAVATVVGITNFEIESLLLGRLLQIGFPSTSG